MKGMDPAVEAKPYAAPPTEPCSTGLRRPLRIHRVTRQPDGWAAGMALNLLWAVAMSGLLATFVTAGLIFWNGLGVLHAQLPKLTRAVPILIIVYATGGAGIFMVMQGSEFAMESFRAFRHAVTRALGFAVVGLSDIARGSRVVAWLAYIGIGMGSMMLSLWFANRYIDGTGAGHLAAQLLQGDQIGKHGVLELFEAGAALAAGALIAVLPIAMVLTPSWRRMAERPKLKATRLAAQTGGSPSLRIAHVSDLHVQAGMRDGVVNERVTTALNAVAASRDELDAVVITGDVTDSGRYEEWSNFLEASAVERLRELLGKV